MNGVNKRVTARVCAGMGFSPSQDEQDDCTDRATALARSLAPEEIRAGDYVTVLHEICELPSFFWDCDSALTRRDELVRMQLVPKNGGVPLKVKSVCLPFVLVKHPSGRKRPLDVRQCRREKLDQTYAEAAWRSQSIGGSKKKHKKRN